MKTIKKEPNKVDTRSWTKHERGKKVGEKMNILFHTSASPYLIVGKSIHYTGVPHMSLKENNTLVLRRILVEWELESGLCRIEKMDLECRNKNRREMMKNEIAFLLRKKKRFKMYRARRNLR